MRHTAGPWKYRRTHSMSSDSWYVITDAEGYGPIMEAGGKDCNGQIAEAKYLITDPEKIEANARLIAAAPEMLDVLTRAAMWLGKMIADGAHENSLLPRDCENTLARAEELIRRVGSPNL